MNYTNTTSPTLYFDTTKDGHSYIRVEEQRITDFGADKVFADKVTTNDKYSAVKITEANGTAEADYKDYEITNYDSVKERYGISLNRSEDTNIYDYKFDSFQKEVRDQTFAAGQNPDRVGGFIRIGMEDPTYGTTGITYVQRVIADAHLDPIYSRENYGYDQSNKDFMAVEHGGNTVYVRDVTAREFSDGMFDVKGGNTIYIMNATLDTSHRIFRVWENLVDGKMVGAHIVLVNCQITTAEGDEHAAVWLKGPNSKLEYYNTTWNGEYTLPPSLVDQDNKVDYNKSIVKLTENPFKDIPFFQTDVKAVHLEYSLDGKTWTSLPTGEKGDDAVGDNLFSVDQLTGDYYVRSQYTLEDGSKSAYSDTLHHKADGTIETIPNTTTPPVTPEPTTPPVTPEPTTPPVTEPPVTPEPHPTEPPPTLPPVTEPPVTLPPVTVPPVTEPPVTLPPVTEPPVTEPPVTEPPVTEPPVTLPPVTEPPVTEPPVTQPPVTEPPVTTPPVTPDPDDKLFEFNGGSGADKVTAGDHGSIINTNSGMDTIIAGNGDDIIDGGAKNDLVSYEKATSAIKIDLADNSKNAGGAEGDKLTSIEQITGSQYKDWIYGNNGENKLFGEKGDDHLYGRDGNDWLNGGADEDTLEGGNGNDRLEGGSHDDKLNGGAGVDSLKGGEGADIFVFTREGLGKGVDKLQDFSLKQGDKLDFNNIFQGKIDADDIDDYLIFTQQNGGTLISTEGTKYGDADLVFVEGVKLTDVVQLVSDGHIVI